jgi:chromosomal replication initiator protein
MLLQDKELWERILADVELTISRAAFSTWFKGTSILRQDEGVIFIGVPSEFVRQWLAEKYHLTILKFLRERVPGVRTIEYIVESRPSQEADRGKISMTARSSGQNPELPLAETYVSRIDNLNPRYTFSSFIIGSFNELAYAAAQAIVANPGRSYNPFFVYGSTGRGKTHLIQSIGNEIKRHTTNAKIYYVTSEKFAMEYIAALQNNSVGRFKEKYRAYDVLIMDDVQFFSKKQKTQEELFHLFNTLYDLNKQIVFSSDKHPNYLPDMESRLTSRFAAGMIVEIPQPDRESRIAIITSKLARTPYTLSPDAIEYLAETIDGNIRELEGVINTIVCQGELLKRSPNLLEIKTLIRESIRPKRAVAVKDVVTIVASFYNLEESVIYEKTRRKEVVKPRQIVMFLLREDFNVSYPTIGQKLGGRDHTTVIHSCEKMKKDILSDSTLAQEINQIRALLK